ncbi:MAG: peptidylprolyl isomerase [Gemmatimonadales bacterium]
MRRALFILGIIGAVGPSGPAPLAAQASATVEALAPILAAEDARHFDGALFAAALRSPDSLVQRYALRAIGRIGDPAGIPLLAAYLADPDSGLDAEAAFALGLIRDTTAVTPIIAWLTGPVAIGEDASLEGATALARIGGSTAAVFLTRALADSTGLRMPDRLSFRRRVLGEAWRLGRRAPVDALVDAVRPGSAYDRYPASYSLARLHPKAAAATLLLLGHDADPGVRSEALKALTRAFADSAGIARHDVAGLDVTALDDPDPGIRITALRSLASFADSTLAPKVLPLTEDAVGNVEVQALDALGALGGARAARTLQEVAASRRPWALRRQALLSLARVDGPAFRQAADQWANSTDWRDRATAAEGWGTLSGGEIPRQLFEDADGRVVAAALQAWAGGVKGADPALLAAARRHLADADAATRSVAADAIARGPVAADLMPLTSAWRRAQRDSFPEAGESALNALLALSALPEGAAAMQFARSEPAPDSYLYRAWAEANWPDLSAHWGPSVPLRTGRTLEDYRAIARQYIVGPDSLHSPHVLVDVAGGGTIDLQLFGADAPLTVANFLRLVDARFFDGDRWHRVVPNFVIQDGDPRGDGWGGPGTVIRDEINRRRYNTGTVGMALSGPDTGGSQWFITLSPQPHLDGVYTVFGQVAAGGASLTRVLQGDLIRSIHR